MGTCVSPQILVPTRPKKKKKKKKKNAWVAIDEVRNMQIAGANEIPTGSFPLATRRDLVFSGYNQVINHLPAGSFIWGWGGRVNYLLTYKNYKVTFSSFFQII